MKQVMGVLAAVGSFVLVLIAMGAGKSIGRSTAEALVGPDKSEVLEQALLASAEQMRAALPMQIDPATTIVDVRAYGREIVYMHRFSGVDAANITREQLAQLANGINRRSCDNPGTRTVLDNGGTMTYAYHDDAGRGIGELSLSADTCTGAATPTVVMGTVARTASKTAVDRDMQEALDGAALGRVERCIANRKEEAARIDTSLPQYEAVRAYEQVNHRYLECLRP